MMSPYKELEKENDKLRQLLRIKERNLDKLEEARVRLYNMFPNTVESCMKLYPVTEIMWEIANAKKYRTGITNV